MNRSVPRWPLACLLLLVVGCGGGGGGGGGGAPSDGGGSGPWMRSAANPLLTPAMSPAPATTREVSIADPCVLWDAAEGRWKAWYSATIFDSGIADDPGRVVIKYAESLDGEAWTAQAAPVLSSRMAAGDWDWTHVETPMVVENPDHGAPAGRRFMLFYAGGDVEADVAAGRTSVGSYPYYQLGLAWSADGRSFTRHSPGLGGKAGLVLTAAEVLAPSLADYGDGLIADPAVVVQDGVLHLWCSSFAETAPPRSPLAFGISLARSADGIAWTLPAANPTASLYRPGEPGGGEQPAVLVDPASGRFEMWFKNDSAADKALVPTAYFTAYGFWRATSIDGITWVPDYGTRDFAWEPARDYESFGLLTGCAVVRRGGVDRMYYSAWGTRGIPDSALYRVPLQAGGTAPAVITFLMASRDAPTGVARGPRRHPVAPVLAAVAPP